MSGSGMFLRFAKRSFVIASPRHCTVQFHPPCNPDHPPSPDFRGFRIATLRVNQAATPMTAIQTDFPRLPQGIVPWVSALMMAVMLGPLPAAPVTVSGLRCDDRQESPVVLDAPPRFSWVMNSDKRAARQGAYELQVIGAWESGKVESDQSLFVHYAGKPLEPGCVYHWRVRIWDQAGNVSDWSPLAEFSMAPRSWQAKWIAARNVPMNPPRGQRMIPAATTPGSFTNVPCQRREAILMRREVSLPERPVRALALVTGMGFVKVTVNGHPADDRAMSPPLTDLTKRVYFNALDVTRLLDKGPNTLGLIVGNGYFSSPSRGWAAWYGVGNEPVASVALELTFADGSKRTISTDEAWKWSTSEITFNDFFGGETQDLRLAQPGWDTCGFRDDHWQPVAVVSGPPGTLQPNPCPAIRSCGEVLPTRQEGNRYVFDAMYTGWPSVKVRGAAGQSVTIEGFAKYQFTLAGAPSETLEPQFALQSIGPAITVRGVPPPPLADVRIRWAHSDLKKTGDFSCSSAFLNHVYDAEVRTHLNYTYDFPMDPTREKTGWTQDVQTMFDSAAFMTDMSSVYRRWWRDFRDSQTADGAAGSVAPMIWGGQDHIWDDPWWSGMIIYTPWKHYEYYGDKDFLAEAYPAMQAYLAWLGGKAGADGLMRWAGASDWIEVGIDGWGPPKRTPTYLVSTCAWYLYADILSRTAKVLGHEEDAGRYAALASRIKDALNAKCFNPATGIYANATNSQTALILPLSLGMVPEDNRPLVSKRLEENIHRWNDHLSTGFVGTPYLLSGLPDLGMAELSYRIVNQRDYAGWNTLITDGVMKETWRGGMAQMPSLGGSVGQWFYRTLAGIRPAAPGFRKFVIHPSLLGDLQWVKAHVDSPYGRIASEWSRSSRAMKLHVIIPANTTAEIHIPTSSAASVRESGHDLPKAEGVTVLAKKTNEVICEAGSGDYQFTADL